MQLVPGSLRRPAAALLAACVAVTAVTGIRSAVGAGVVLAWALTLDALGSLRPRGPAAPPAPGG